MTAGELIAKLSEHNADTEVRIATSSESEYTIGAVYVGKGADGSPVVWIDVDPIEAAEPAIPSWAAALGLVK